MAPIEYSEGPEFEQTVRAALETESQVEIVYPDTGATDVLTLDEDGDLVAIGHEGSDEDEVGEA